MSLQKSLYDSLLAINNYHSEDTEKTVIIIKAKSFRSAW
jgi:hypothetical protein